MLQDRHANTLKIYPQINNKLFLIVNIFIFKICIDFFWGGVVFLVMLLV